MTRERQAKVATIVILGAILTVLALERDGRNVSAAQLISWLPGVRPTAAVTPQETIYRMLDAARDGNVRAYLRCYTGRMDSTLRQIAAEKGDAALAAYIRNFNAAIKGVAIQEPQPVSDLQVRLRVEFVYQDRNETQFYYLEKSGRDWKISRLENTEGVQPPVPYGTTVE
jgi:hypothetical protein